MSAAFGCVGNTIRLRSGRYLDLLHPQPDQFSFYDIAGALSKVCRFGGQIDSFYSVAEHSVHCSWQAEWDGHEHHEECVAALLHDAAEAFVGDLVKPLKVLLPTYVAVEKTLEAVIGRKFGVEFERHADVVREIDRAMLIAERKALFRRQDKVLWAGEESCRVLAPNIGSWIPPDAESRFIFRASALGIDITR